ncbi:AraC family transcriptional regulator [Neorhizobium sp. 2083]|uniref:helix-turn-helix domain-containing protein n=1 Tax=Neorhizobium sp. 2083 TaxID=2817762 RepID=UPI002860EEF9|nr:helix-turn-helix domain-containing protein [Neorhizobium sp. 2083]MDR6816442.1 AraC family transcriptional regulator [Neorhizobium sp. 2083]
MPLLTHGDRKYQLSTLVGDAAEWDALRVEHRHIGPGSQNCVRPECTELVYILSGRANVRRRGDGQLQEGMARAGTSWLVPAGTHETLLELDGSVECLLIFLPARLLDESALADYGIDPDKCRLAYAGGFSDPTLAQIGTSLHSLLGRDAMPADRIFADGLRTTLAAHLIGNYTVDRWRPSIPAPSLDPRRLKRVLDFIEAKLGDEIALEDLAREACLSPFHFSRLFHETTGLPPHRYVIEHRIRAAQSMLVSGDSTIAEIALDTGFGSQANFARTFRKVTGMTPRQYRGSPLR